MKAQGVKLGRPSKFEANRRALAKMLEQGDNQRKIADELGVSYNTAKSYIPSPEGQARGERRRW